MSKSLIVIVLFVIMVLVLVNVFHSDKVENLQLTELKYEYVKEDVTSVDHSKFKVLQ